MGNEQNDKSVGGLSSRVYHQIRAEILKGALMPGESVTEMGLAKDCGVSGYLVKPIDEKSLVPNIEVAVARSKEMKQLRQDIAKVTERLESRTVVEKAKGLVMAEQGCTEQVAYDYIRRISLEKKISMRRVAEIILMKNGG